MRPLVLLVLAELVVLVLLSMQWLGGSATVLGKGAQGTPPPAAREPMSDAAPARVEPGAANASPAVDRSAAASPAKIDAKDPIGIVLRGAIRSTDGTLVEGASVGVSRDRTGRGGNSAGPGCYAIAGLQPGEWKLTCRADGYAPHEAMVTLDERAFQQVDIELQQSYVVRVKVLGADGKPIVEQLQQKSMWGLPYVVATEQPLAGDLPPTAQAGLVRFGLGEWQSFHSLWARDIGDDLRRHWAGELRMRRAPPAYASLLLHTTLLRSQRLEAGQKELVFTIEADEVLARHGTVKLRLVDGVTGSPIADADVIVRTLQGGGSHAKTDADGRAVIGHVVPGLGVFEFDPRADREGTFRYVLVPSGGTVDLGEVSLTALAKITGNVVDAGGKPAAGASVQFTELDCRTFPQPLVDHRSAATDADGKFQLWGCGRHRYVVFARLRDGGFGHATVDATGGAPAAVTIALATPTRVTLQPQFEGISGYYVTALANDRSPVAVATLGVDYRAGSMLLLPGAYTVEIHDAATNRLARSFPLQVGSEPLNIDVP